MATLEWDLKDPQEIDDFTVDWTRFLGSDTISTSAFDLPIPVGLVIMSDNFTASASIVRLSGGTAGGVGQVHCRITTARGRTLEQTVQLKIAEL